MKRTEVSLDWGQNSRPGIQYCSTDFGELRIRKEGQGEKTVIFIPDAPAMIEHHDGIFDARPEGMSFLSIEPIGTGFSLPDARFDFSFEQFAKSLMSVIENQTRGKVTLAAGCCNGYFSLMMAAANPDKIDQLLIWQTAGWDQNTHFLNKWIDPHGQLRTEQGSDLYERTKYDATKWWFKVSGGPTANDRGMTETAHTVFDHGGCHCLPELVQSAMNNPAPDLQKVDHPATLLWCGSDATHADSTPESLLPYFRDAQIVHWADAGHMPDLEFPERLVALISTL